MKSHQQNAINHASYLLKDIVFEGINPSHSLKEIQKKLADEKANFSKIASDINILRQQLLDYQTRNESEAFDELSCIAVHMVLLILARYWPLRIKEEDEGLCCPLSHNKLTDHNRVVTSTGCQFKLESIFEYIMRESPPYIDPTNKTTPFNIRDIALIKTMAREQDIVFQKERVNKERIELEEQRKSLEERKNNALAQERKFNFLAKRFLFSAVLIISLPATCLFFFEPAILSVPAGLAFPVGLIGSSFLGIGFIIAGIAYVAARDREAGHLYHISVEEKTFAQRERSMVQAPIAIEWTLHKERVAQVFNNIEAGAEPDNRVALQRSPSKDNLERKDNDAPPRDDLTLPGAMSQPLAGDSPNAILRRR